MKRDMELLRQVLLTIEADPDFNGDKALFPFEALEGSGHSRQEIIYHLRLAEDGGLIIAEFHQGGDVAVRNLTSEGHDFLDSVRDPEIWRRTKACAVKAGGFTVDILKELAKSLIKAAIQQHLTGPGS
jgi:hypothetical protein